MVVFLLPFVFYSCSTIRYKKQGFVSGKDFFKEIPFTYFKEFIIVPVKIENKEYNFLFDTGAELNIIDPKVANELNLKLLKKSTITSDKESEKNISMVELKNINIGGINFQESVGMIWDLSNFTKLIGCIRIDGIIGNNLMRKVNWQINYENRTLQLSDKMEGFKISNKAKKISMNAGDYGNIFFNINIRDKIKKFTFDTGYNGFMQTGDPTVLENETYFTLIGLTGANFNGKKSGEIHYSKVEKFCINGVEFKSPSLLHVKPSNSSILGNQFYENFILTIDWKNDLLYLDPQKEIELSEPKIFEVNISADYGKNEILVGNVYKGSEFFNQIKPHSKVLYINEFKVNSFKGNELCEFMEKEWVELKKLDELILTIESELNTQKISVKKIKNPLVARVFEGDIVNEFPQSSS